MALDYIHQILNGIAPLATDSERKLIGYMEEIRCPKGFRILNAGKREANVYILLKGIARIFAEKDGDEISFWFSQEGDTILSFESYIHDKPGYETVELIEDSTLLVLKREDLIRLYQSDINIANWGRCLAEKEMLKIEKRMLSFLSMDATARYCELLHNCPDLLQRIPLGLIASYLGVTQTTLSRIRAKVK